MGTVGRMINDLVEYTCEDLDVLEREHPELGRLEIIDGGLHGTGESALGILHQLIVQRLFLLLAPLRPRHHVIRLDAWWISSRGRTRADLGIWRAEDKEGRKYAFRRPPYASLEVLSLDGRHDTVTKDDIYAEFGTRRAYIDPEQRWGWWARLDGVDHDVPTATWQLDGWPPIVLERDRLLSEDEDDQLSP